MGNTSMIPPVESNGTLVSEEIYPADMFGMRKIPIVRRDIFGRKSGVDIYRVNQQEYEELCEKGLLFS